MSDKILLLVKMIWQQKSLHLFEHIALQHMYKNKKSYVFNDLNTKHIGPNGPIGVNFDTYLHEILDSSGLAINMKNLLIKIETDNQVIEYFKSPHILHFKYFLLKNFSHVNKSSCDDYFLLIFKPIQLSRTCFHFYLGVFIIFIWHSIFNKDIIS